MSLLDSKCKKCGVSFRRQALFAMMGDCGAQTLDPSECPEGGDHIFIDPEEESEVNNDLRNKRS